MGLKRHEPHWEVTDDLHSFNMRTGIIRYHAELVWYSKMQKASK